MNKFESPRPRPGPTDEAFIRGIMDAEGISFDEAREKWEMMKADVNYKKLTQQDEGEEKDNG